MVGWDRPGGKLSIQQTPMCPVPCAEDTVGNKTGRSPPVGSSQSSEQDKHQVNKQTNVIPDSGKSCQDKQVIEQCPGDSFRKTDRAGPSEEVTFEPRLETQGRDSCAKI